MTTDPVVVVVAYGAPQLLERTLVGIAGLETVVVDNSSSDDVRAVAQCCDAQYLRPGRNLGFAAGVNLGLDAAGTGRDILLLNPDAVISSADALSLQLELRSNARTAAVAPRLQRPDGSSEPTCWPIPSPRLPWKGVVGATHLRPGDPFFLSGAVLLLRADALEEIGTFDQRYFLYAEETDWQIRAQRAGWEVKLVPSIVALHEGGGTSNDSVLRTKLFHGSAELLIRKWYGRGGWTVFRLGSLVAASRRTVTAPSPDARRGARQVVGLYLRGPASQLPDFAQSV